MAGGGPNSSSLDEIENLRSTNNKAWLFKNSIKQLKGCITWLKIFVINQQLFKQIIFTFHFLNFEAPIVFII